MSENTCATCQFINDAYWGHYSDYGGRIHFCKKSDERRRDTMKPTGDFAEDFMANFRTFFNANAVQRACKYYAERAPIEPEKAAILVYMLEHDGKAVFKFFTEESLLCSKMNKLFVEKDDYVDIRGSYAWRLTEVGKVEARRVMPKQPEAKDAA